jgi:hypothetical protein
LKNDGTNRTDKKWREKVGQNGRAKMPESGYKMSDLHPCLRGFYPTQGFSVHGGTQLQSRMRANGKGLKRPANFPEFLEIKNAPP